MKIVQNQISINELKEMAEQMFGNLVKAVVDVEKEIMAIDGELHADLETILIESGSRRESVWGINIYPDAFGRDDWIEFDSMINLKPALGNKIRGVENEVIRKKIIEVVNKLIPK